MQFRHPHPPLPTLSVPFTPHSTPSNQTSSVPAFLLQPQPHVGTLFSYDGGWKLDILLAASAQVYQGRIIQYSVMQAGQEGDHERRPA